MGIIISENVDNYGLPLKCSNFVADDQTALPLCPGDCDCPEPNVLPGDIVFVENGTASGCICSCGRVIFILTIYWSWYLPGQRAIRILLCYIERRQNQSIVHSMIKILTLWHWHLTLHLWINFRKRVLHVTQVIIVQNPQSVLLQQTLQTSMTNLRGFAQVRNYSNKYQNIETFPDF